MKILVCCLVYGHRPHDIIHKNLERAGMPFNVLFINREGIANALNDGIDYMMQYGAAARMASKIDKSENLKEYDAIAYLANDIEEPDGWLLLKSNALKSYPDAGIVASSLDFERTSMRLEHIISNWLISSEVIKAVGYFNEHYFPYGAIDNEYCVRAIESGFKTYYTMHCLANHISSEDSDVAYGYSKSQMVEKYSPQYLKDVGEYQMGLKDKKISKR